MCCALRAPAELVGSPDEEDYDCFASAGAPAERARSKATISRVSKTHGPGARQAPACRRRAPRSPGERPARRPPLCSDSRSLPAPCVPGRRADALSERPGQASNAMRRNRNDDAESTLLLGRPQGAARSQSDDDVRCSEVSTEALENSVSGPGGLQRQCVRLAVPSGALRARQARGRAL